MDDNNKKHNDIDALLSGIFKQSSLRELFNKRMRELGLTERAVRAMLKIEYRTLNGIIDGTEKGASKTSLSRDFWLTTAKSLAAKIDNPYHYDRQNLVAFFPQIRWYSTNEEFGLANVIKELFKIGITVIFQPRLSTLHLRGATFSVNNKPVIVLTDYKGFYATLWHC